MSDLRKAAEHGFLALKGVREYLTEDDKKYADWAYEQLRQALAQPEQKPVAWGMVKDGLILDVICAEEHAREPGDYTIPLYTAPPKREWVGLTGDEQETIERMANDSLDAICLTEAKLKEKNT